MKDFKELKVWEKSHQLTLQVYQVTAKFPQDEIYGLRSQIRRACASIPTNIAEGCGRQSDADFGRFLSIAMGSASELEYLLFLSKDLNLINESDYKILNEQLIEIKRMLGSFITKLRTS
jgi:four helix bundle protein